MNVTIFGCGRLGSLLAQMLDAEGHRVTVLDTDSEKFERLPATFKGEKLAGVGIDVDFLRRAGLTETDAFLALSGDDRPGGDNTNVMASQIAKQVFGIPLVISQMKDPLREDAYHTLGIETICPTTIGADLILTMIENKP